MNPAPGILGPDGRPVNAERVRIEKLSRFNPLRNFTPDVLVRQLEAYQTGQISQLAWVMEWMEHHDDIIATVAPKAKAAVSRYGYDIAIKDQVTAAQKPLAEKQRAQLETFFQSLETGHALDLDEAGGMRLLAHQIMDGYGKGYSAHHIIFKPSGNGLTAKLVQIPLWFFEAAQGRLRFLPSAYAYAGVDLETLGGRGAWMISKGRGVMLAGVVARTFKQIPLQDWLTYCDRHGMPMFLGKTAAQKGSDGWTQMASAVAGMGAEYGAVINSGDMIEVINLAANGQTPYKEMIERMDRAQVILWRGGDLSTMSRAHGTGSNPQTDDTDELDADNAAWVSETINRSLTARVVEYYHGKNAPVLCELKMRTRTRDNVTQDLAVVTAAKDLGVRISKSWFLSKFNVVEADVGEPALAENLGPKEDVVLKRQISYATWKREQEAAGKQTHTPPPEVMPPGTTAINYNPDQLRAAKGSTTGGRWTMAEGNSESPLVVDGIHLKNSTNNSPNTHENAKISRAQKEGNGNKSENTDRSEGYPGKLEGAAGQAAADVIGRVARSDAGRHPSGLNWVELGLIGGHGRIQAEQSALAQLAASHPDIIIPEIPANKFAEGGEHTIEINADGTRVVKHAKAFGFSLFVDTPDFHNPHDRSINIRPSTAGEYLERMKLQNDVFGDDIRLEGLSSDGRPVISQRAIKGRDATDPEITAFMKTQGFREIPSNKQSLSGVLEGTGWYHPEEKIMVADLRPANVKVDAATGTLLPIDVIISRAGPEEISLLSGTTAINARPSYYDPEQQAPDLAMQSFRDALAADLRPLGDALYAAYQSGDAAAMTAALKKISKNMPTLAGDASALAGKLAAASAIAFIGDHNPSES